MKLSTYKALALGVSLLMVGCTTTYKVDYVDADTGGKIDAKEFQTARIDCNHAWTAYETFAAPPATSSAGAAPVAYPNATADTVAVALALELFEALRDKSDAEADKSEFREECLLSKGFKRVLRPA